MASGNDRNERICYNISIQDSRYDHNFNTFWGRMKRAAKILLGKLIYYNDVHLKGEEAFNVTTITIEN